MSDNKEKQVVSTDQFEVDMEEIKSLDSESNYRDIKGKLGWFITLIAISMSIFQLYTSGFGLLNARFQRTVHLAFAMGLIFLLFPATKNSRRDRFTLPDVILAILGVGVNLYIILNLEQLAYRAGKYNDMDVIVAVLAVLLVLEAGRRVIGIDLPILGIIFLLYAHFGPYLPGVLAHRGYNIRTISTYMYLTLEGIYSTPLAVAATYVFLFVLFGVLAEVTGLGQLFIDIAVAIAGRSKGGPAKVAVIASGLMGSINGSSIANTVTTGAFTIPLMKKSGYKAQFAGAVEAASSTGGQIMPPVMGAAAFIMSEFLGIPYLRILTAAIIPAILYYLAVGTMVHLEASKNKLSGLERVPVLLEILRTRGYLLLPMGIIIWRLIGGYTPLSAGFWGVISALIIHLFHLVFIDRKSDTLVGNLKHYGNDFVFAFETGAKSALGVTASCAAVGFIVGTSTLTGLGLTFAGMTINLAESITGAFGAIGLDFLATDGVLLFFTLFFTMIACTILGSGIPTTATYIILAMIASPALTKLGVPALAAHMFVLYFGVVADLTPPVALAAYAGAGIAGSNPFRTGFTAVKLAIAGFVVPFIFVYNPVLLLQDVSIINGIYVVATAVLGIIALGAGMIGYLRADATFVERALMFLASILLLIAGWQTDIIGFLIIAVIWFYQSRKAVAMEAV